MTFSRINDPDPVLNEIGQGKKVTREFVSHEFVLNEMNRSDLE